MGKIYYVIGQNTFVLASWKSYGQEVLHLAQGSAHMPAIIQDQYSGFNRKPQRENRKDIKAPEFDVAGQSFQSIPRKRAAVGSDDEKAPKRKSGRLPGHKVSTTTQVEGAGPGTATRNVSNEGRTLLKQAYSMKCCTNPPVHMGFGSFVSF